MQPNAFVIVHSLCFFITIALLGMFNRFIYKYYDENRHKQAARLTFFKEAHLQVITTDRNYMQKYYKLQRTVDGCVYFGESVNKTCVLKLVSFIAQA